MMQTMRHREGDAEAEKREDRVRCACVSVNAEPVLDYVEQPADTLPATAEDDRKGRTKAANRFLQPQLARNPVKQSSRYLPQGMRAKPRVGGDSVVLNSRNVRLLNESPHQ